MASSSSKETTCRVPSKIVSIEVVPSDPNRTAKESECISSTSDKCTDESGQNTSNGNEQTCLNRHYGALFGLSSAFAYGLQSLAMEVSTDTMDPLLLVVVMSPVMLISSLVYLIYSGIPLPRHRVHYVWLFLTSLAISAYANLFSIALSHAEVGDVVTITYTSVILIAFLGWMMLGETFGVVHALMAVMTISGVVFVSRPPFIFGLEHDASEYQSTLTGIGFALATSVAMTFVVTSMRKHAVLGISVFHTMFANGLMLITLGIIFCTVTGSWHCLTMRQWATSLAAGVCNFVAQTLCLCALKHDKAMIVNILLTSEIIFAFLLQLLILRTSPSWTSYVGSVLIIVACIVITVNRDLKKTNRN